MVRLHAAEDKLYQALQSRSLPMLTMATVSTLEESNPEFPEHPGNRRVQLSSKEKVLVRRGVEFQFFVAGSIIM